MDRYVRTKHVYQSLLTSIPVIVLIGAEILVAVLNIVVDLYAGVD